MTKLEPTDLIAIEVPKDADETLLKAVKLISNEYNFEIIGEVTADEINFDVRPFLKDSGQYYDGQLYYCFGEESDKYAWDIDAFYSLLQSNGLYFENPMGEKSKGTNLESSFFEMQIDFNQEKLFEEAESKVVKGKLVILKPI